MRGNPYSGVAACAGCHGANGGGTETLPRLAGQHAQYTENQLKAFNKRERTNDNAVMHSIASKLSELELKLRRSRRTYSVSGRPRRSGSAAPAAPSRRCAT